MNTKEREAFWNTLCGLPGKDPVQESGELSDAVKFPKYIFRYRKVDTYTLEALRTNKLYFSSALYYDDPFDTFLHIDVNSIRQEIKQEFETMQRIPQYADSIAKSAMAIFGDMLTEEQKANLLPDSIMKMLSDETVDNFLCFALGLRDELRKNIWSTCFSEDGYNESLWLKYADKHKGFVLIYDLDNNDNYLCGKKGKCQDCPINTNGISLYPIYYSDKSYDATKFIKVVMLNKIREQFGIQPSQISQICQIMNLEPINEMWEHERVSLIKKKCHEYDAEWRLIPHCRFNRQGAMEWVPCGIILGLRMEQHEEKLVISLAKEAGIKNICKSFIDSNSRLNTIPLNLTVPTA